MKVYSVETPRKDFDQMMLELNFYAFAHPDELIGGFIREVDGEPTFVISTPDELITDVIRDDWIRVAPIDPNGWPPLRAKDV